MWTLREDGRVLTGLSAICAPITRARYYLVVGLSDYFETRNNLYLVFDRGYRGDDLANDCSRSG